MNPLNEYEIITQAPNSRGRLAIINFCGMSSHAETIQEARRLAMETLTNTVRADHTPKIITHKNKTVVLWRDAYGYMHGFIDPEKGSPQSISILGDGVTREEAENDARYRLAQACWSVADGTKPPDILTDEAMRKEFTYQAKWYTAADFAKTRGLSSDECRIFADLTRWNSSLATKTPAVIELYEEWKKQQENPTS